MPRLYLDLRAHRDSHAVGQTPWTPAISVVYQVDEGIRLMAAEGAASVFARHEACASAARAGLRALGFELFADQLTKTWCVPAALQMALATLGLADTSDGFQRELEGRVREWESYSDSHNGKWGPSAMVLALEAYGAPGYEVRGYETRQDALRDAAVAIESTRSPVILLAWKGAHTWVMTGFRADADPRAFRDATIEGAYVLDPWYPWVSSIWGPSDPPGTFQDQAEMERNFLPWKRPEGRYPERDGLFISVVPTVPVSPAR